MYMYYFESKNFWEFVGLYCTNYGIWLYEYDCLNSEHLSLEQNEFVDCIPKYKYQRGRRLRWGWRVTEGRKIQININLRPKSEDGEFTKRIRPLQGGGKRGRRLRRRWYSKHTGLTSSINKCITIDDKLLSKYSPIC